MLPIRASAAIIIAIIAKVLVPPPMPKGALSAAAFTPVSVSPIHQLPLSPIKGVRPSLPSLPLVTVNLKVLLFVNVIVYVSSLPSEEVFSIFAIPTPSAPFTPSAIVNTTGSLVSSVKVMVTVVIPSFFSVVTFAIPLPVSPLIPLAFTPVSLSPIHQLPLRPM